MKKTYVLDTNVLLSDPNSIFSFQDNDVIIPMIVLEELDRHKSRPDEVGKNARHVSRMLDDLRSKNSNLFHGVKLKDGGTLKIVSVDQTKGKALASELQPDKPDNMIISVAATLRSQNVILVSKDINVRLKCDAINVKCEDYLKMRVTSDQQKFYRGVDVLEVPEELINFFYENRSLELPESVLNGRKIHSNQIVIIKTVKDGQTVKSAIAKKTGKESNTITPIQNIENVFGLQPKNKEQKFSLDLLFDPEIKLLTLVGPSGTGKTLMALASALEQLKGLGNGTNAVYEKLIVTRPIQPVGKEMGFLPGTLEEKMEPWIAPIRDNLSFLINNKGTASGRRKRATENGKPSYDNGEYLRTLQANGLIEIEAITFIRGRSIPNAFIIIDEAQNLSMHELKTIITRAGDGTKIVLTGDIEQIDNVHVDVFTNGLTYAVEKFKDQPIAGHVTLTKGERSPLATIASQIL